MRDLAIVGGGAMGLVAAQATTRMGLNVTLFEAGSPGRSLDLGEPEQLLARHNGVENGWDSGLGGTTKKWGGQLWAWESYEFEPRSWVDESGWPITRDDLLPFYSDITTMLRMSTNSARALLQPTQLSSIGLNDPPFYEKSSVWLPWRKRNFGRSLGQNLLASRIDVREGAQVIRVDPAGSSVGVWFRDEHGALKTESFARVIIAAGTLGNIFLLQKSGLTDSPWLGRGFMDHVDATYARFRISDTRKFIQQCAGRYAGSYLFTPRYVMNPHFAKMKKLVNAYGRWEFVLSSSSIHAALRQSLRDIQARRLPHVEFPADSFTRWPREVAEAAYSVAVQRRRPVPMKSEVVLRVEVEQPPRRASSIGWSFDSQSNPSVQWLTGDEERAAFREFGGALLDSLYLKELGLELVDITKDQTFEDRFHLMGGTRLGLTAGDSVVDQGLAVHGISRLLVAGASTFRTGSVANPTMTAAALMLRSISGV